VARRRANKAGASLTCAATTTTSTTRSAAGASRRRARVVRSRQPAVLAVVLSLAGGVAFLLRLLAVGVSGSGLAVSVAGSVSSDVSGRG
jgi:hypothetical protein